jgi:hypothetical protein
MLLAGPRGVCVLEEDPVDVLVIARLQFGARDVSKDVHNGCGVRPLEVVQEGRCEDSMVDFLGGFLAIVSEEQSISEAFSEAILAF